MPLTGKQRRTLRAKGHHLQPIVQVGGKGVTAGVISATGQALADHELVKVKLADEDRDSRKAGIEALARETGSEIAQVLGRTALLFKQKKKKSKFVFKAEAAEVEPAAQAPAADASDDDE